MITALSAVRSGALSYVWRATSNVADAVFYWWVDGHFFQRTAIGELELRAPHDVRVDVFDDPDDVPQAGVSQGLTIVWEGAWASGAVVPVRYRVEHREQDLAGVWGAWSALEEYGSGAPLSLMRHTATGLTDEVMHGLRVIGIDEVGEEVVLVEKSGRLLRRPDVPSQAVSVSGGLISVGA